MNIRTILAPLFEGRPCIGRRTLLAAAATLALTAGVSAQTVPQIGLKLCINGNGNLQNTDPGALLPTDTAGAPGYAQTNWNTLGRWGDSGAAPFNILDSTGANSGIIANWDANNIWSQAGGGTPTVQGSPDGNLMNAFDDSTGNANVALANTVFGNPVANKPLVYLSGIKAWLTSVGATYYDVVLYSDGDGNSGRVGEYWLVNATGPTSGLTYNGDLSTHVFICDVANFVSTLTYVQVPPTTAGGILSEQGQYQGNYTVFTSLTNDSFLLRTEEFNFRSPINAIQIVPRSTPLPAVIDPLIPARVYAGGTATFRAGVAGVTPMSFQWQRSGTNLIDVGNISGSTSAKLTISAVSAADAITYSLIVSNAIGLATSTVPLTVTAPVAGSYAEKIFTNKPVAYWRLNDTGDPSTNNTPALDSVGGFSGVYLSASLNAFDGIVGPQPTGFPGFEVGNTALQSAGNVAHSWVYTPPLNLNTNTVTIAAWVYPTVNQLGSAGIVMERNGGDVSGLDYQNAANQLGYTWNNASFSYNFQSGLIVPTNQWSFVALVVTPTNATLYLYNTNGQNSAVNTTAHAVAGFTGPTLIGDDAASAGAPQGRAFTGVIDEPAVFNWALPQSEIYNLYKKGLGLTAILPVVSTQPISLDLFTGRTARFSVLASGDAPLTYKWRKNGITIANGGNTNGANTASLTISNLVAGDAAAYDVVVNNLAGSITSSVANLTIVASNSASLYESVLQATGPASYWRLNETNFSPAVYDYWGGNIATPISLTLGTPGPIPPDFIGFEPVNTDATFDGLSSYIDTGAELMNNLPQFSLIGWFNSPGTQAARTGLFGQNDTCEFGFHGVDGTGQAQLGVYTPNGGFASFAGLGQTMINPGQWYFTAAVGDGSTLTLYLFSTNGILQTSVSATTTNYGSSGYPFRIGGGGVLDVTGNFFTGGIDEVALFTRALTIGELSTLFGAAQSGGALPPTIAVQPASATLYAGRTAQFPVTVAGSPPLTYQWRSNGIPLSDGGNLTGSHTATLTITSVGPANAANYDLVVTNVAGAITSSVATLAVIPVVPGSYAAAVLAANPLAYYRLNETGDPSSGTLVSPDFVGGHNGLYGANAQNAFNGILGPVPPVYSFEANNGAMSVAANVASSYATAPIGSLSTNAFTFTAWLYPVGNQLSWSGLLVTRTGVNGGFNYNDQQMLGYTWNNNNVNTWGYVSGLIPPQNQWSFVAVVIQPTQAILYLYTPEGVTSATNVVAHTPDAFGNSWEIGSDNSSGLNDGSRNFNGVIDEVGLFSYSMTAAQLTSLYSTVAPSPVTLTIQESGSNVVLTWGQGTLLEAPDITGPWTTNNASSPYTTSASAARKFYRVRVR